jgi:hypothetical protein|tara:strand:- start:239 stop:418 length:180 start_codon:yes stop_codon:yes gene_type:complete
MNSVSITLAAGYGYGMLGKYRTRMRHCTMFNKTLLQNNPDKAATVDNINPLGHYRAHYE